MGLRNWVHNRQLAEPVDGQYELTACSIGDASATYSNCRMQGVVTGPGVGPTAVEHSCMAPTKKWPQAGQVVPVTVDRDDPTRLRIRWDDIARGRDAGMELAEQLAEQRAGETHTAAQPQEVVGAPGRPVPGSAGGGLTPEQAASGTGLQPATARVLAVHDIDVPAAMAPTGSGGVVDLTLDVTTSGGEGYTTTMRIGFSTRQRRDAVASVGRELPVLVNPQAHDQVAVDVSRMTLPG